MLHNNFLQVKGKTPPLSGFRQQPKQKGKGKRRGSKNTGRSAWYALPFDDSDNSDNDNQVHLHESFGFVSTLPGCLGTKVNQRESGGWQERAGEGRSALGGFKQSE